MTRTRWSYLAICILLCQIVGAIGFIYRTTALTSWYGKLTRPGWLLPEAWFQPAWILFYLLFGLALFNVWQRSRTWQHPRVLIFVVYLAVNLLWFVVLFGLQNLLLGLLDLILLCLLMIYLILATWTFARRSAWLLLPGLGWLIYLTIENAILLYQNS
jgi:tryptophan-rich sensory protein